VVAAAPPHRSFALRDGCASTAGHHRIQSAAHVLRHHRQLVPVALLVFLNAWNEFVIASIMTSSALMRTAQVFLYLNMTDVGVNWGEMMASALAINLPVLALFLLLQRRFIAGLTAGALRF
jgi:ABC-type glycerol-3-phosphate transport system permease component